MNKSHLKKIMYLFWDHIGELRYIPPITYDGIFYAVGLMNLFLSYQTVLFPLQLLPRFQPDPGTVLGLEKSWEHW